MTTDATLRKPRERSCELCGRAEQWDDDVDAWQIVREDGEPLVGDRYCIHEWDINGAFVPIENGHDTADA
jgi:hypothetical protein